jgi:hypothetical protein
VMGVGWKRMVIQGQEQKYRGVAPPSR